MNRESLPGYRRLRLTYHGGRRSLFEAIHDYRYSRPALFEIDRQLAAHLPAGAGFFVEAGANDGYSQSNTYYLDRALGWKGLLIEPLTEFAEACSERRPRCIVDAVALVSDAEAVPSVEMTIAGLVSSIASEPDARDGSTRSVRTATLTQLLTHHGVPEIDFMSLDMEGAELDALRGLDLHRFSPGHLLIEMLALERDRAAFDALLAETHEFVSMLSPHDVLYRRRPAT
jgi:FkbM family methyltransferase